MNLRTLRMRLDEIERNVQRRLQPTRAYPYGPWAASFAHLGLSEDQEGEGSVQYGYVSSCRQHQRQGEARLGSLPFAMVYVAAPGLGSCRNVVVAVLKYVARRIDSRRLYSYVLLQ